MSAPRPVFCVRTIGEHSIADLERFLKLLDDATATATPGLGDRVLEHDSDRIGMIQSSICEFRDETFDPALAVTVAKDTIITLLTVGEREMDERRTLAREALVLAANLEAVELLPIRSGRVCANSATPTRCPAFGAIDASANSWSASMRPAPNRAMLPVDLTVDVRYWRGVQIWDPNVDVAVTLSNDPMAILHTERRLAEILTRIEEVRTR